jgi:hypothetical protein
MTGLGLGMKVGKALGGGYGPELYNFACAAADVAGAEADAIGSVWSQYGLDLGSNVWQSQGVVVHGGSFALHAEANDTPTNQCRIYIDLQAAPFNFVNGEEGKLEFYCRHVGTGSSWSSYMSFLTNGTTNQIRQILAIDTTFTKTVFEWVHSANHQYWLFKETGSNDGGIYLDAISIRKKL